ncbi:MAG: glycosyltransferase [Actinomycetota bacterium]
MNATTPVKLSVVTVCFNDLANAQRTIDSLSMQTRQDGWEHLLIDGASTDGTADWYRSVELDFPHRLVSEPDCGIFDAMNKSLNLVNGEYVLFMNAGDRFADGRAIGRMLARLDDSPGWSYSRARTVDTMGNRVRPNIGRIPYSRFRHLYGISVVCHQTVVMRVDMLRELGGFDPQMENAADYHLLLKAASRQRPATYRDEDVDYLAGGVSDREVFNSLRLAHRCRVDALRLGPVATRLDAGWTALQVRYVGLRKRLKPIFGSLYLKLRT